MRNLFLLCTILLVGTATASADTVTIATFDDPAADASTPLISYDASTGALSGGWSLTGLTLETISGDYDDATFTLTADPGAGPGLVGPGEIEFLDSADNSILSIIFDSGMLNATSFGATEFLSINDVTIAGPAVGVPIVEESFSFGFANQAAVGSDGSFTATAAFTSSARVIPEPASLLLVAVGGLAMLRRGR